MPALPARHTDFPFRDFTNTPPLHPAISVHHPKLFLVLLQHSACCVCPLHGKHLLAECRIPSPCLLTRQNTLLCTCCTCKSCWPCRVFRKRAAAAAASQRLVQAKAGKGEAADVGGPTVAIYPHLCRSLGCCRLPPAVYAAGPPAAVSGPSACSAAAPAGCSSRATRLTSWVRLLHLGRVKAKHGGQHCTAR